MITGGFMNVKAIYELEMEKNINMNEYVPDAWVLLRFESKDTEPIYKILGGWYGGYAGSDSWRLCSGIERIELIGDVYHVHNYSGSVYTCHKDIQRFSGLMNSMLASWLDMADKKPEQEIKIEVIDMGEYYVQTK